VTWDGPQLIALAWFIKFDVEQKPAAPAAPVVVEETTLPQEAP
jgi:hypothetical protein